ncbi:SHOCT domain-containing protein [Pedobacter sp.]|uniref:SHOCT domain-containing protein n=1 Tax=Pedobacter sp. TaxID=1411316 RepID=UPI00396CB32B
MKKKLLLIAPMLFASFTSMAQNYEIIGDTLITPNGHKIIKNEQIDIGVGSTNDGDFRFIRVNSGSLFKGYSANRALANSYNAYPREKAGGKAKVIRVELRGSEKKGFTYYLVLGGGVRYEVDIKNAIDYGEIIVPNEHRKDKPQQQISKADELKKYKQLLDEGAITQEEYDKKKKQLLDL